MMGVRLLETLRLDQTKNSKRLSAVLRRWSCLTFNTTDDAADVHPPPTSSFHRGGGAVVVPFLVSGFLPASLSHY
jgi:hypothetical protein